MVGTAFCAVVWSQSPFTDPTILKLGCAFRPVDNAGMDGRIDGRAGQPANFQQIAALGLQLGHLLDLLRAQRLVIHHHAVGAGRGGNAVERHHDNARIAGLLDRAVEGVGEAALMTMAS